MLRPPISARSRSSTSPRALTALVLCGLACRFAGHVGRYRRSRELHPVSWPDRVRAFALPRRADDLPDIWGALLPPAAFIGFHLIEANFFTPLVVGHRLTISPLSILVSLSFWAWVWGTPGALSRGPAVDHHEDRFLCCRHARHRRISLRTRHPDRMRERPTKTGRGTPGMEPAMVDTPQRPS